jgi:hypothetical protein
MGNLPFMYGVQRMDQPFLAEFHNPGEAADFSQSSLTDRLVLLFDKDPGEGFEGKPILSGAQEPIYFGSFGVGH